MSKNIDSKIGNVNQKRLLEYAVLDSLFGKCLILVIEGKLAELSFVDDEKNLRMYLEKNWPNFEFKENSDLSEVWKNKVFNQFKFNSKQESKTTQNKLQDIKTHERNNLSKNDLFLKGTDFQLKVWAELLKIPYGQTRNYQEIAKAIGKPKAVRAVGTAIGKNPIAIWIPCHRVINKNGNLGGYRGGLKIKIKLLEAEKN